MADSNPEAEYEATLAKAAGFIAALENRGSRRVPHRNEVKAGEEAHFKIGNGKLI